MVAHRRYDWKIACVDVYVVEHTPVMMGKQGIQKQEGILIRIGQMRSRPDEAMN